MAWNSDRGGRGGNKNDNFINQNKQQQQMLMQQQDEQLEELGRVAERLHTNAQLINNEIVDQQRALTDLDQDIDQQADKLNFVMKRMAKLLKTNDSNQLGLVLALFLIFIFLLFVLIYT
eukprot:GDKI01033317.1.p2 GENE.GDKI01033317.1~~GDKI01033317.1.p2  ORF type:complete len:119 (-),score=43.05 GDKI01033317.1:190-546(-)